VRPVDYNFYFFSDRTRECVCVCVFLQCVVSRVFVSVVDVRQCCRVCAGRKEAEPSGADASISSSASALAARRNNNDKQLDLTLHIDVVFWVGKRKTTI
jgi:hypothetical protein